MRNTLRAFCMLSTLLLPGWITGRAVGATAIAGRAGQGRAPVTLTLQGLVAGVSGGANERVYTTIGYGSLAGNRHKLSELNWDISGVAMAGMAVTLEGKRMLLRISVLNAVTDGDGQLADYDWFLYDRADFWTHRSVSDVSVDEGWQVDFQGAVRLIQKSGVEVAALAGLRGMTWKWTDSGADYVYSSLGVTDGFPESGYSWEQIDPSAVRDLTWTDASGTTGIRYEQQYWIPYAGLAATFTTGRFQLGGHFMASGFVQAEDIDDHLFRGLRFNGRFFGGNYFAYGFSARMRVGARAFVRAEVEAQEVREMIGDMTIRDIETGLRGTAQNSAGLALQSTTATMAVGLTF
jgi:outer membrane protease